MGLRDLAESQLACKQQAQAAEDAARQSAYAEETVRLCAEWFLSTLKTQPDSVTCMMRHNEYRAQDRICLVMADGIAFRWSTNASRLIDASARERDDLQEPGVTVVEWNEQHKRWYQVTSDWSYQNPRVATDLPSLALHLQAVDKVLAKRKART